MHVGISIWTRRGGVLNRHILAGPPSELRAIGKIEDAAIQGRDREVGYAISIHVCQMSNGSSRLKIKLQRPAVLAIQSRGRLPMDHGTATRGDFAKVDITPMRVA